MVGGTIQAGCFLCVLIGCEKLITYLLFKAKIIWGFKFAKQTFRESTSCWSRVYYTLQLCKNRNPWYIFLDLYFTDTKLSFFSL